MDESILGLSRFGSVGRSVSADGRSGALQTSTAAAALGLQGQHPRGRAARAGPQHIAGAARPYRSGRPCDGRPGPQPGLAFDCRSPDPGLRRQAAGGWRRHRRGRGESSEQQRGGAPKHLRPARLQGVHSPDEEWRGGSAGAGGPTIPGIERRCRLRPDSGQPARRRPAFRRRLSRRLSLQPVTGCTAARHHSGSGIGTGPQPRCSVRESAIPAQLGIADSRSGDARLKRKWGSRSRPSFRSRCERWLRSFRRQKRPRCVRIERGARTGAQPAGGTTHGLQRHRRARRPVVSARMEPWRRSRLRSQLRPRSPPLVAAAAPASRLGSWPRRCARST